jgi:hypothetical protein
MWILKRMPLSLGQFSTFAASINPGMSQSKGRLHSSDIAHQALTAKKVTEPNSINDHDSPQGVDHRPLKKIKFRL